MKSIRSLLFLVALVASVFAVSAPETYLDSPETAAAPAPQLTAADIIGVDVLLGYAEDARFYGNMFAAWGYYDTAVYFYTRAQTFELVAYNAAARPGFSYRHNAVVERVNEAIMRLSYQLDPVVYPLSYQLYYRARADVFEQIADLIGEPPFGT